MAISSYHPPTAHSAARIHTVPGDGYRCDGGATLDSRREVWSDRSMEPTRREVLQAVGAGVALACGGAALADRADGTARVDRASEDALDEALQRIHRREPESVRGLSTHAPMVVEVLSALGRGDRVGAWLDGYRGTALQLPRASRRIEPQQWRAALPHAWRAAAVIYTMYARRDDARREPHPTLSRDELIARAIARGDEHVIKLTETLLSEHAIDPRPVYLAAAEAAVT